MKFFVTFLTKHPASAGIISSLGGIWVSFLDVLPTALRLINMGIAMLIGLISLALKVREWRQARLARIRQIEEDGAAE